MNKIRFGFLASLIIIGAVVVHAQTREGVLKKLKNASGELSEKFKNLDKNSDGRLTEAELNPDLFEFLNTDGDDAVTLDEAEQAIRQKGMAALREKTKSSSAPARPTAETPSTIPPTSSASAAVTPPSSDMELREGPQRLIPGEHRVGQMVADLELTDIHGHRFQLSSIGGKVIAIAFTNTTCPVCKKYAPSLASLEKTFASRDVTFLFVNPTPSDKMEDIETAISTHGFAGKYVRDKDGSIAMAVGATRTTDVVVLDAKRTIVYRGAVDDQYGFGYSTDAPRHRYLRDAIDATLNGESPEITAMSAPGCPLNLTAAPRESTSITYYNRISRLIQNRCLDCHRDGGVAPFALGNYEEVTSQSGAILQVIQKGVMPPWFAAPAKDGQTSPFANDCSLSKTEKTDLLAWLNGGMPQGNSADAPIEKVFTTDWQIGKPDYIIQVDKPLKVKATGTMPYQNVFVDTGLSETKYLKALEVRPTAREVVHHILVFVQAGSGGGRKASREEDDDENESSGFFAAYAPGYDALVFNDGYGKVLPAGSRLKFQIHYTPNGTATEDRPMIGMRFLEEAPENLVDVTGVSQIRLAIPPNADNHQVVATQPIPNDATILAFFPHMHLRGKAFKYEAILPGGETKTLLDIPRYDFNWQLSYRLAEPVTLPKGSTLRAIAWYDNSSKNLANPDPNRTVRWGPQTTDEMMIGYVEYHMEDGSLGKRQQLQELRDKFRAGGDSQLMFKRFDADGNGKLELSELPEAAREFIGRLDADKDGSLTQEEAAKAKKLLGR